MKFIKHTLFAGAIAMLGHGAAAGVDETHYSNVRGWQVVSLSEYGDFIGCGMLRSSAGVDMILLQEENRNWELGFPTGQADGTRIAVDMNLDRYSDNTIGTSNGIYVGVPIGQPWLQALAKGNQLTVHMEGWTRNISLHGTSAAIAKVQECVSRKGRIHVVKPVAPSTGAGGYAKPPIESDAARMGAGCPAYGAYRSPNAQDWGEVQFTNNTQRAVNIYWIDFDGHNAEMGGLLPGESVSISSNAGHHFIAKDFDGTCYGGVWTLALGENHFILR